MQGGRLSCESKSHDVEGLESYSLSRLRWIPMRRLGRIAVSTISESFPKAYNSRRYSISRWVSGCGFSPIRESLNFQTFSVLCKPYTTDTTAAAYRGTNSKRDYQKTYNEVFSLRELSRSGFFSLKQRNSYAYVEARYSLHFLQRV